MVGNDGPYRLDDDDDDDDDDKDDDDDNDHLLPYHSESKSIRICHSLINGISIMIVDASP